MAPVGPLRRGDEEPTATLGSVAGSCPPAA